MKNLEQIRAQSALALANTPIQGANDGEVIKKIPPYIMNHGLLATAAFAYGEKKAGFRIVFNAIAQHLSHPDINILPKETKNLESMMRHLTEESDSQTLKMATQETMAWLAYACRFVKKERLDHE